jgi:hypothetical protein
MLTTEGNKSGILWSSYQKTVYLPYFCSKVQNQGLGTELLRQIEKMFIAANYTSMVVFSTPNQIQFYSERGFASLTQPKLIGSSVKGQKFVKQLSEITFLNIFGKDAVPMYKMCSETSFRRMLTCRGIDYIHLVTVNNESKISSLERRVNDLDIR